MVMLLADGKYLKGDDVKAGDIITFLDEGVFVESARFKYDDGNPKVDFIFQVDHSGEHKKMRVNKTNKDILIEAFGRNTQDWVGKKAKLTVENILVGGERRKTIILIPEGAKTPKVDDVAWDE